ncbi:MAG: class I adenylate-forming enzyme family protein [Ramlibacter sp.]
MMPTITRTTPDTIDHLAQQNPDALAVIDEDRLISRAQLRRELDCMAAALHDPGVVEGSRVALACEHGYVHWLLVLACERLGAVSDAVLDPRREDWATLHQRAGLLLSTFRPPPMACGHQLIDQGWLDQLLGRLDLPALPALAHNPDAPARVARTSGTTGASLRLLLSRADVAQRVRNWARLLDLDSRSRYLLTLQPAAATACYQAAACVQAGAVLVFAPGARAWQSLARHGVTHATCLPGMLAQWLFELPSGFARPAELRLLCGGAAVSPALRGQALARLATSVEDFYASNEAGLIATGQSAAEDAAGTLWPGVQVQVVDGQHNELPAGHTGRIRVRAPGMAQSYLDAPHANAAHFYQGWFYPGDVGVMPRPGQLRVTGRESEVMNLGGLKVSPEEIEARLSLPGVPAHELAVCALPGEAGIDEVWVALCGEAARQQDQVVQALAQLCNDYAWVTFRVVRVPAVNPRAPGKLSRRALRDMIAALQPALQQPAAPGS